MTKERKILIVAGTGCAFMACAGLLAASVAIAVDRSAWAIPSLTLACVAFWIGRAIACTLRDYSRQPKQ